MFWRQIVGKKSKINSMLENNKCDGGKMKTRRYELLRDKLIFQME